MADDSDEPKASDSVLLEPVTITASGTEKTIIDAPASISVITSEQLAKRAFRDLSDALTEIEGVNIVGSAGQAGGGGRDISIRGMPAGYTLILVDGKRQNSRSIRTNGDAGFEVGWIPPLEAIERIEVVRGPMSSLYGSDAMGGVVNIITRKVSSRWMGSVRAEATVQENSDSGNAYGSNFYISGPLKTDLLGVTLWGSYYYREEDNIVNGYNEARTPSIAGRLAITPTRDQDILLEAGTSNQKIRSTGGKSVTGTAKSEQDNNRDYYSATHIGRWSFGTSEIKVYREEVDRQSTNLLTGVAGTANEAQNDVIDIKLVMPLEKHLITVGGQWREENVQLPSYVRRICRDVAPYVGCPAGTPSNNTYYQTVTENIDMGYDEWAVFAEDEWSITQRITLTGGLRYEDNSYFGDHLTPRGYVVYKLGDHWAVKGGVSGGYKTPSVRSIVPEYATSSGGATGGGSVVIRGNPDLKPESSVNTEIGIQYSNPELGLSGGLTFFNNDFKDKLVEMEFVGLQLPEYPGARIRQQVNVAEARLRGIEANLRYRFNEQWSIRGSYTWIESEVIEDPVNNIQEGAQVASTPKQTFSATLDWQPTKSLGVWLRVLAYDSIPVTVSRTSTAVERPGYTVFDLGANYRLTDSITLFAAIYNFGDKELDYSKSENWIDGRRYWLGANYKF